MNTKIVRRGIAPQKPFEKGKRIHLLDELRGLAIVVMVIYHAFFTIGYLYDLPYGVNLFAFFAPAEPFFAGMFIFICGISCHLSHNNWKRGGLLMLIAAGITAVLWVVMPDEIILFGILHFLSVAILLYALLRPLLDRIPPLAGLLLCALLFALTWRVPVYHGSFFGIHGLLEWPVPPAWVANPWLYPLGFGYIPCSDYFPILPWIFLFFAGSFCGVWVRAGRLPSFAYRKHVPPLAFCGKHTLLIYVVHQPVIYALCYVVLFFMRTFAR